MVWTYRQSTRLPGRLFDFRGDLGGTIQLVCSRERLDAYIVLTSLSVCARFFGKTQMEHIMVDAFPELPKWSKFRWTQSIDVCGLTFGIYPVLCSKTCCIMKCAGGSKFCGNETLSVKTACYIYCIVMMSVAGTLLFVSIATVPLCMDAYVAEFLVRARSLARCLDCDD
jgi:hypothetical protein